MNLVFEDGGEKVITSLNVEVVLRMVVRLMRQWWESERW